MFAAVVCWGRIFWYSGISKNSLQTSNSSSWCFSIKKNQRIFLPSFTFYIHPHTHQTQISFLIILSFCLSHSPLELSIKINQSIDKNIFSHSWCVFVSVSVLFWNSIFPTSIGPKTAVDIFSLFWFLIFWFLIFRFVCWPQFMRITRETDWLGRDCRGWLKKHHHQPMVMVVPTEKKLNECRLAWHGKIKKLAFQQSVMKKKWLITVWPFFFFMFLLLFGFFVWFKHHLCRFFGGPCVACYDDDDLEIFLFFSRKTCTETYIHTGQKCKTLMKSFFFFFSFFFVLTLLNFHHQQKWQRINFININRTLFIILKLKKRKNENFLNDSMIEWNEMMKIL